MLRHWNHIRSRVHHRSVQIQSKRSTESTFLGVPVRALLYLAKTVCAAEQDMVFRILSLNPGTYKGVERGRGGGWLPPSIRFF